MKNIDDFDRKRLISVAVITYNQEKTIAQTLDSIIEQEGNFDLEIVIGDDCSADNTIVICKEYRDRYPDIIKLFLQKENQGVTRNFIDTICLCKGEYIGICAGDDYWCDKFKIQKQLDFFDQHADYGVVSTGGYRLLVEKNRLEKGIAPLNPVADGNVFDLTWRGGIYAMPLSILFKSELLRYIDFKEFIKREFSVEDVPMQAIMAHHTKFGHIPDLCVVYRVYNSSLTYINYDNSNYISYHQGLVEIRRYLHELFPNEVDFSQQWANDYMVYRHFLKEVYHLNYKQAKEQLKKLQKLDKKEKKAKFLTRTWIGFYIFALVKHLKLRRNKYNI